ncbi:MAG: LysO family transporter [Thermococcus sp.]|uniref:LysO family transporter n=1 Tax=Thermococcus sp. TaxID=35749 RepID=UPI001D65E00D|nr:LysO family transporter [Thermococcus sp.]MBO8173718.1 LysO family transporter [Thermococcus sp.]
MNIFIPLLAGIIFGYLFRRRININLDKPMSATLLLLIFFMGVEAGRVEINAVDIFISSLTFAVLTILGSLFFAVVLGGRVR